MQSVPGRQWIRVKRLSLHVLRVSSAFSLVSCALELPDLISRKYSASTMRIFAAIAGCWAAMVLANTEIMNFAPALELNVHVPQAKLW